MSKKYFKSLSILIVEMLLLPCVIFSAGEIQFESIFNGEDLTGWQIISAENDMEDFVSVENGAINFNSDGGHGWLWVMTEKEYTDFVLKLKFTGPSGNYGNSGINFRSRFDQNDDGGYLNGPQVDVYPKENWRTGLILDMTRGNERWLQPDIPDWSISRQPTPDGWIFNYEPEWNDLEIRVIGTMVTTIVNGITYIDEWDGDGVINTDKHKAKNVGETGFIALQAHSSEQVKISYKDIEIQDLTNGTVPTLSKENSGIALHTGEIQSYSINGSKTSSDKRAKGNNHPQGAFLIKNGMVNIIRKTGTVQ